MDEPAFDLQEPALDLPPPQQVAAWLLLHSLRPLHERRMRSLEAWGRLLDQEHGDPEQDAAHARLLAWRTVRLHLHLTGRLDYGEPIHSDSIGPHVPLEPVALGRWLDQPQAIRLGATLEHLQARPASLHPDPHGNGTLHAWRHTTARLLTELRLLPTHAAPAPTAYPLADRDLPRQLVLEPFEAGWPAHDDLIVLEDDLSREHLDRLIERGLRAARKEVRERYGLNDQEAGHLDRLAKRRAVDLARIHDIEEERSLTVLQIEEAITIARASCDNRALYALLAKQAIVKGVTRAEPEDIDADITKTIARVAREAKERPPLPPPPLEGEGRRLPPPPP